MAEAERQQLESLAQQIIEPVDPVTAETAEETMERERLEDEERLQLSIRQDEQRKKKGRETERLVTLVQRAFCVGTEGTHWTPRGR